MKLDSIHDLQGVYRKVLNAMARPGVIENINQEAEKVDIELDCFKGTFLLMLMLLDGEVTFHIISENTMNITSLVSQMTYAKIRPLDEADYIFVLSDANSKRLALAYRKSKIGDLVNPNSSATIIAEFEEIKKGTQLELVGPGIKEANRISISESRAWIRARKEKNQEYPLGIDGIYIDKKGNVMCLPRTTQIKEES
ncbi:phosphonate C-P lyase system protein PhnH [Clostridium vincentii]|uniref:Alpha-D-ribose 1-methylphosphonate 5-triphosphate synthase subunit PhnH n=1 Tax=Clostridium vincentii TaxID=52704 RepID=A0A2T0BKH5_9CLOT|nr:phosphonate C-P lyase system protein PhnH [Clostridium vincentii]PRR84375.1 Alpha-D-ribose 1-methylphosphonate 5-triphosphate synthase subunit PhnH [Clostridium vincentii]